MISIKRVAVVGGIPNPIGGVTTFIKRLVRVEKSVSHLFDLYPSESKNIPYEYSGKYYCDSFKFITIFRLFCFCLLWRDVIHFNFSTPKSLVLLALLPKFKCKWIIMLHHGDLGRVNPILKNILLRKIDVALALNKKQKNWYSEIMQDSKIKITTSYVKPLVPNKKVPISVDLDFIRTRYKKILVCSGYPTSIYNHLLALDLMIRRSEDYLFICLYGQGDLYQEIIDKASALKNVHILEFMPEDEFNYLLYNCDLYLRLNSEDSFGVAVADAVRFGTHCLATNVCQRYQGAFIINLPRDVDELSNSVDAVLMNKPCLKVQMLISKEFDYKSLGVL